MGMWKTGHVFYPENEWDIAERQAKDRAREEENATKRQRREGAAQGSNRQGDYPEQAIVINMARRWGGNQDRGKKRTRNGTHQIHSRTASRGGKRKTSRNAKTRDKKG